MLMNRINGENLEDLVLQVVGLLSEDGKRPIKPAKLYEELRKRKWDIDDNDIRNIMSKLLAEKRVLYTFERYFELLTPTSMPSNEL